MAPPDAFLDMFENECKRLKVLIDAASTNPGLTPREIVETYYQVMNVSAMISVFKVQLDANEHKSLLENMGNMEGLISEKFNADIHPRILSQLTYSIQELTKNLQSDSGGTSREEIESESKYYEALRKQMSTKEFVEQYSQELPND